MDSKFQKQPFRGVLIKRSSENMQQIYRRSPMSKCDFNEVEITPQVEITLFIRTPFPGNTSGWLLQSFA